jgi:hypothetical protein
MSTNSPAAEEEPQTGERSGFVSPCRVGSEGVRAAVVTRVYSVDLSVRAAVNLCLPTAGVGARIPKTCGNVKRSLPGHGVRVVSEARRARGVTPAGGRHPLQPADPSAPREVTEAFEGGSSLNAGLTGGDLLG